MERIPNGRYTKEFRVEAVKLVTEGGLSVPEAGRRLSLPPSTLNTWVKTYKAGKLGEVGRSHKPLSDIELDLARTKRELAELFMFEEGEKRSARKAAIQELVMLLQNKSPDDIGFTASILRQVLERGRAGK